MDSGKFIEKLEDYGILVKEDRQFYPLGTKIEISYATIEGIDFDVLWKKGIKELFIKNSKISKIKFSKQNDVEIHFESCDFLNQVFALECNFQKKVEFVGCNFQKEANFDKAIFQNEASFDKAIFQNEASFYKATFRTIANFNEVTFQMRVIFNGAIFQNKVFFFNAKFLAKQEDMQIIENSFGNVTFEKEVFFNGTLFQTIVSFNGTLFQTIVSFNGTLFQNEVSFYKATFKDMVSFEEVSFQAKVSFNKAIFQDKVIFFNAKFLAKQEGNQIIKNSLKKVTFKKQIDFSNCQFLKEVDFKNNEFYEAYFKMSKFKDNVYFNNSYFKDYADFHECEFEKNACFYGVKFEKVPNFSACYFKDQKAVNLINVDIDKLNFKSVENYIKDNYKDKNYKDEINKDEINKDEKSIFKIENKYKLKCAKDCKDSFRVIKDVLTNQNNTLEAQEWHKLELYAKEVELEIKLSMGSKMLWYDRLLLYIYRNTSNHHLDFVTILNFTVSMISIYGLLLLLLNLFIDDLYINNISPTLFSIVVFFVLAFILKPIFNRKIFIVLGLSFIFPVFFGDYIKIVFVFFIYLLSLCLFYLLFNLKNKYFIFGIRIFVYVCAFCIIIVKPQLINPFIGVFSSDKLYESQLEKKLNDLNANDIINFVKISQKDFNLSMDYKDISFTELNSAKKIIIDNKENLKEILSSIYNKDCKEDYKRVLQELENNASNLKNIIQQIDKKNNNSFISARLYEFLKSNFGKFNDLLYLINSNFSFIAEKLTSQELATFDKKDNQEKLKNILSLLKFEQKFEEIAQTINQDEIMQKTIKSTSILYSIILLLCIFSLQKTARKNSIVPS